jgi:outer membrane lipoprotein-sorting protein
MTSSGTTTTSKYWIKMGNPTKFKMESTVAGQTTVTIFDGTRYYMYTPSTNTAIVITVPPAQPSDANSTTQYNPVYIGSKTVNGYACDGYQYTASGVLTTMWISTQYGVAVEISSSTGTIDYSNFNFSALPDSTFQLPAGAIIMTIPGM